MSIFDKLTRANSQQIAQFILHETALEQEEISHIPLEERCIFLSKSLDHLMQKIMNDENGESPDFLQFTNISVDLCASYFELGMKAGITFAISLELANT